MKNPLLTLFGAHRNGDDTPEPWLGETLGALDPARTRPGYWAGFHHEVMRSARSELARRRRGVDLTVSDVVSGWSRALVPAALAAALAAFLLMRPGAEGPRPLRLEEALLQGSEVSSADVSDAMVGEISFSVEVY